MGTGNQEIIKNDGTADILVANTPLSFGVSKMLEDYQKNSEALLE